MVIWIIYTLYVAKQVKDILICYAVSMDPYKLLM